MPETKPVTRNPWMWVPSLYFAQGLPFAVVNFVSIVVYKSFGVSNTDIAFYTAWLYLPWVIKPLWSPVVDILKTRRLWIWLAQLIMGAGFAAVALALPLGIFFQATLAIFYLIAFSSATHDIGADGYYLLATTEQEQSFFVGIRSTFFRISMISAQGLLVILAGFIQNHTGLPPVSLRLEAPPEAALVESVETQDIVPQTAEEGDLRVIALPATSQIRPVARPKTEVVPLITTAKNWNLVNGFTLAEKKEKSESWWSRTIGAFWSQYIGGPWKEHVSEPLGSFLQRKFGQNKDKAGQAGNIAVVRVRLSKRPGKEIIVTPAISSGDKNFSVAEGSRLIFNDQNWDRPALVVFQLDAKVKSATSAVYKCRSGNVPLSWTAVFFLLAGLFVMFGLWHKFILPYPTNDQPGAASNVLLFLKEFFLTFGSFFTKPKIGFLLLFLLLYRFGEAQLVKMVAPFLLDPREVGGIGLTTEQYGLVYGTIGIIALTVGGLMGGFVAAQKGLKFWIWPMALAIHLPDAVFIYLAYAQPDNLALISASIAIEQFGYGFGFTAYMLYMIYIARGKHSTAHYAICTGFMAMSMMFPGMWSGWLQEIIGYPHFFVWVILATVPSFLVVLLVPLDKEFGKKTG